ncbi:MAG: heat-inducible transcription repressor HrcA [Bacilli bacterium]|nr:heat-inducible transcription repressor HrcA [Bacilli bacterium]
MNERREELLKVIVENYIKTVKPVGSRSLCETFNCSSATIRNEMGVLEDLGYIEKNHISSGRIPSEKGYKYYVDHLMKPKELTGEDVLKLQTIFTNHDLKLSDAISKCMEIISDITNYTSVVLGTSSSENALQQVNIIPLTNEKIVAVVVTDKGIVENKQFTLPPKTNIQELVKTSEIINKMLVGTPIDEVSNRLEFEIKPIISRQINQYEAVYNIFHDAFNDFVKNTTNVHVSGKSKMLNQPEYNNTEDIRRLVNKFEDENLIRKLVEDKENNRVNVYIGEENDFDNDVTIVKSKYNINGEEGTIAIVGPKRMEYDKVVGLLDYITKNLETRE